MATCDSENTSRGQARPSGRVSMLLAPGAIDRFDHVERRGIDVGDECAPVPSGRGIGQSRQQRGVRAADERHQPGHAVDVEEHELRTLVGDDVVQRVDQGRRAHRGVDERVKRQYRRQLRCRARRGRRARSAPATSSVRRQVCRPAFAGNELYLNGLYSG